MKHWRSFLNVAALLMAVVAVESLAGYMLANSLLPTATETLRSYPLLQQQQATQKLQNLPKNRGVAILPEQVLLELNFRGCTKHESRGYITLCFRDRFIEVAPSTRFMLLISAVMLFAIITTGIWQRHHRRKMGYIKAEPLADPGNFRELKDYVRTWRNQLRTYWQAFNAIDRLRIGLLWTLIVVWLGMLYQID